MSRVLKNEGLQSRQAENKVPSILRIISGLQIVIGIIAGLFCIKNSFIVGVTIIITSVVGSIFIIAFSQVIDLLQEIANKI